MKSLIGEKYIYEAILLGRLMDLDAEMFSPGRPIKTVGKNSLLDHFPYRLRIP